VVNPGLASDVNTKHPFEKTNTVRLAEQKLGLHQEHVNGFLTICHPGTGSTAAITRKD
jgi:hypothetical protein